MCGYPLARLSRTLGKGLLRTPLHPHGQKPACGRVETWAISAHEIPDRRVLAGAEKRSGLWQGVTTASGIISTL